MSAVIAIVGRPNVGKSTLFNRLTRSDQALVGDRPGVTRDRLVGEIQHNDCSALLIDTGGLGADAAEDPLLAERVGDQSLQAVRDADLVLWLVDGRAGLTADDEWLAGVLRPLNPRIRLVVNKIEGQNPDVATAEFYRLGIGEPLPISALRGDGITGLQDAIFAELPEQPANEIEATFAGEDTLRVAVLGRPNAGKSTLINRLLGEDRMLTFDRPGTTRDSVATPLERKGRRYLLIDTAGVRRKAQVQEALEKISIIKTLKTIDDADVMILVIDARIGATDQDAHLLGMAVDRGKALIITANKWDGLDPDTREQALASINQRLMFADYARLHCISALHGSGVGELFETVEHLGEQFDRNYNTALLTDCLQRAVAAHPPPLVRGRRIKPRYAHLGGRRPLRVIVHGNQVERLPHSYKRYLARALREQLELEGLPLLLDFRQGDNPYAGRPSGRGGRRRKGKRTPGR